VLRVAFAVFFILAGLSACSFWEPSGSLRQVSVPTQRAVFVFEKNAFTTNDTLHLGDKVILNWLLLHCFETPLPNPPVEVVYEGRILLYNKYIAEPLAVLEFSLQTPAHIRYILKGKTYYRQIDRAGVDFLHTAKTQGWVFSLEGF
jgi:hypothetical protein